MVQYYKRMESGGKNKYILAMTTNPNNIEVMDPEIVVADEIHSG